jgi:hypothetical protein
MILSIATGNGLDDRGVGVRLRLGSIIFTSPYRPDRLSYPISTGGSSPWVKRQEREADSA